jgi:hypothetical protein
MLSNFKYPEFTIKQINLDVYEMKNQINISNQLYQR